MIVILIYANDRVSLHSLRRSRCLSSATCQFIALAAVAGSIAASPPLVAAQAPVKPTADTIARRAGPAPTLERILVTEASGRKRAYHVKSISTATKTITPLRDVPQSATIISQAQIADQAMQSMSDVVRYIPGITMGLGEGHRDAPTIRGNSTTADFFIDGIRDDAQYYRDVYNVERVEALKGSNAMVFGRGGGGGVLNRVTKTRGVAADPHRDSVWWQLRPASRNTRCRAGIRGASRRSTERALRTLVDVPRVIRQRTHRNQSRQSR